MADGIRKNEHDLWEVTVGGKMVARVSTEPEAVREYVRAVEKIEAEIARLREEMMDCYQFGKIQ